MKLRQLFVLLVAASVSMWASAQSGNSGLNADERLRLLKANRVLLEDLLDQGARVSDANTPLDRAAECQRTTDRLAREFREALDRSDADRANEIGDHVQKVVVEGFVPNLETARLNAKPGSPDYERVKLMHREAAQSLDNLGATIPKDGPLSKSKRLQQAREKLAEASTKLGKPDEQ